MKEANTERKTQWNRCLEWGGGEVDIHILKLKYAETRNMVSIISLTLSSTPSDSTHTQILNIFSKS